MKTLRLIAGPNPAETPEAQRALDAAINAAIDRAAEILRAGGLVALPTETVYGLGANALDAAAVERIFAAKQRPAWDPIIVHIASASMLDGLVANIPAAAHRLMDAFWPGPLTLLLPRTAAVPDAVTAGRTLVGVRMPAHPVALELIRRAGVPIAAPSANLFARVSPTTAAHVLEDLDGRIDAVLDAGPTARGVESTVLDPSGSPMTIYRPGAITAEQIRAVAGPVEFYRSGAELPQNSPEATSPGKTSPGKTNPDRPSPDEMNFEALPAPGVGLRHYSPKARLVLVEGPLPGLASRLAEAARACLRAGPAERLGAMLPAEVAVPAELASSRIFRWGRWAAPEEMARLLYAGLRALDAQECSVILCPLPPAEDIGAALRDRLQKAARPRTG